MTESSSIYQHFITPFAMEQCSRARLLNEQDPPYPINVLLIIPGSGNTWTRLMIEHLTGILTGAIYYDVEKVRSGLNGETFEWPFESLFISYNLFNTSLVCPKIQFDEIILVNKSKVKRAKLSSQTM